MKLSRKGFKVVQLITNQEDYCIYECLYILGISFSYCWHAVDGLNGDIAFKYLNSAEEKLEELEQLEEVEGRLRDGSIMLFLIFLTVVLFGVYKLMF